MTVDKPVARDGKVHVMSEMCSTCIGRPGNLMRLAPGRLKQLVQGNLDGGAGPPCHQTTYGQDERGEALCRWYVDTYGDRVLAIRLARAMHLMQEQPPIEKGG